MSEKYRFILAEKAGTLPGPPLGVSLKAMCRALRVSRSGLYEARHRQVEPSQSTLRRTELDARVLHVFHEQKSRYGSRRVQRVVVEAGCGASRSTIARSMQRQALMAARRRPFRVTTDSNHKCPVAPNLLARNFCPEGPNVTLAGDITYVHTAEGWLYLAVILDLWSRRVVGYATSRFIDRHLVISAMRNAIGQRTLQPATIFHSDLGSQYASDDFIDLLRQHRITQSMSRKGDCWDNAPSESFFSTLKQEGLQRTYATRQDAQDDIDSFMRWYNAHRLHSFLQYRSPMAFEAHAMSLAA